MATVVAVGSKLPLQIIVKGKTPRCLVKLGGIAPHVAHFSNKGWQTVHTFKLYIRWAGSRATPMAGRSC
jgi:hypothetical protein